MLKNTIVLIALGLTQSLFSQEDCCEQFVLAGDPIEPDCIAPIYPFPGAINLECGWDVYVRGDFLYFSNSHEEDFINSAINLSFDLSEVQHFIARTPYKPGFRVACGINLDDVVLDFTYIRYHSRVTSHFNASEGRGVVSNYVGPSSLAPVFGSPQFFFQNITDKFEQDFDYGRISLQNPIYISERLILNLGYGLLGIWSDHRWDITGNPLTTPPPFPGQVTSSVIAKTDGKTWAIGPDLVFQAIGLLPWHFKAILNVDLSLMYGSCTKALSTTSTPPLLANGFTNNTIDEKGHADHFQAFNHSEIGLGWGSYFWCDRLFVDLSITYNFILQHVYCYGQPFLPTGLGIGIQTNYSIHGLSVGGRIDF